MKRIGSTILSFVILIMIGAFIYLIWGESQMEAGGIGIPIYIGCIAVLLFLLFFGRGKEGNGDKWTRKA